MLDCTRWSFGGELAQVFETLRLIGPTRRSIVLQTHRGREIENEIELEPGDREIKKYADMLNRHTGWVQRKPACGIYNCVGHVWASRRTSVFGPGMESKIELIFEDDGYRVIDGSSEPIMPGDLATYWEPVQGRRDFLHVGVVSRLAEGPVGGRSRIPWVLSKWDSASGEVEHHFAEHPFLDGVSPLERRKRRVDIDFWTERPARNTRT